MNAACRARRAVSPFLLLRSTRNNRRPRRGIACLAVLAALAAGPVPLARATPAVVPVAAAESGELVVYDGGLKNGWQDWGWAHRTLSPGQPARLNMSRFAGWILALRNINGTFGAVTFRYRAPAAFGSFLEVRLGAEGAGADDFPKIPVEPQAQADGWTHVSIPFAQLNPSRLAFDRVVLRARKAVGTDEVFVDHVSLLRSQIKEAPKAPLPVSPVRMRISCKAKPTPISPYIYGIAFSPRHAGKEDTPFGIGASVRRWGGNPASRYNPRLGNAWNTASDWFFQNVNYTSSETYSWRDFLKENAAHDMQAAMTVPTLGWVAKDTDSHSFSVAKMGPQKYSQGDAGNGMSSQGTPLTPPAPQTTSIEASPEFIGHWVQEMEAYQKAGHSGAIMQYILDNEPALWNSTHRDVHPQALTYDELLERTISYGEAVRKAAPRADIAGPAEWGWPAYFFSARDAEAGFRSKPDRRAHGDVPLLAWYLQKLRSRAGKTGLDVLDTVDLHFYPQISGVYGHGEQVSPQGAQKRLRATRSLWDPTYKDESWIADTIELLPRLQRLIADNYPGRKISIGEYNFGGERHISGGLAQAEALGRFAQAGVHSAYLWTYPAKGSASAQAFLSYRNYDGSGSRFLDQGLQTEMGKEVSLFASRSDMGDKLVAIVLNLRDAQQVGADIELDGCGAFGKVRTFGFDADSPSLQAASTREGQVDGPHVRAQLPAYSLTVLELSR